MNFNCQSDMLNMKLPDSLVLQEHEFKSILNTMDLQNTNKKRKLIDEHLEIFKSAIQSYMKDTQELNLKRDLELLKQINELKYELEITKKQNTQILHKYKTLTKYL